MIASIGRGISVSATWGRVQLPGACALLVGQAEYVAQIVQNHVAGNLTVGVVELLETVHIQHDDAQGNLIARDFKQEVSAS